MQFEKAYNFLIIQLDKGLPSYTTYHNTQHTKNVINAASYLADLENVTGDDRTMLLTAALFHDAGFLQNYHNHESISCQVAKKHLPDFEYSPEQIDIICNMIMATQLPQSPTNHLSQIICDADLFYLGTDEYEEYSHKLFLEFKRNGIVTTYTEWIMKQIEFISAHHYFTKSASSELENKKQETLKKLKFILTKSLPKKQKVNLQEMIQDAILNILGVFIAGIALKYFLVPNQFFDGGITGLSLLLHELYHFNLSGLVILLNIPLIILSYFTLGQKFAIRIFTSVVLFGACLYLIPTMAITHDKLLVSVFGGIFLGLGIGLVMRAGAALDGIEVLALYTLKRTSFTITEIILGLNILIFTVAAFEFGIETSLYSILTYFAATRTIDYVVEGIQAYTGVTIISGKSEAIKYELVNKLGRGITIYKGERGFLPGKFEVSADVDIIFTVITRMELRKLKNLVYEVDSRAFVYANTIKEASGGILTRRHTH
ncbi:MAG: YitT family protein [Bacteroidetes bacterium]|nr:YitT family protein [Bacteroidota bacterium]